ncbi:MAG: hypothetical protein B6226_06130 [Candidatus Cloacimonetes bacterium 4572_65]|nr:MAG: hypothetical protein B6226_06130 [Candidatus Cloacimonetes bacterium 4572_65]
MKNKIIDLHIHTTASDGSFTREEILEGYYRQGFKVISITDHDTVDAYVGAEGDYYHDMRVIVGSEISCRFANHEVHILGYDIDYQNPKLLALLTSIKHSRVIRAKKMVSILNTNNVDISYAEVQGLIGSDNVVGRPHIAQAVVNKGYFTHPQQVFNKYIGDNGIAYVPKLEVTPKEVIDTIHQAGGFAVMAHPIKSVNYADIPYFKSLGLDGIEVYYYDHTPAQIKRYEDICRDLNLIKTTGSDFHGSLKKQKIGVFTGPELVIDEMNKLLKKKIEVSNG